MNAGCVLLYLTFPAEARTHLPTPEGWKAELASVELLDQSNCYINCEY